MQISFESSALTSLLSAKREATLVLVVALLTTALVGCGTIKTRNATDQLLVSDAVDQTISQMDFAALSDSKVYLDTRYARGVPGVGFVNADYITSALRERMVLSGCLLQESMEAADYVVEVRIGALGTDGHEVNYGIPGNNAINATTNLVGAPAVPPIPELSLARKDERRAAVKVGVFAYHRASREPVWQSGMVQGNSVAKATWILGAGPFHDGKIYSGSQVGRDVVDVPEFNTQASRIASLLPWSQGQTVQQTSASLDKQHIAEHRTDTETAADESAQTVPTALASPGTSSATAGESA